MEKEEVLRLKAISARTRSKVLRMMTWRKYGHLGGAMSIIELLTVLYNKEMHYDPGNPNDENRDYLVLSKGHAGAGLYATLSSLGYFPERELFTMNEGGTMLPSHPDRLRTPGVDATTGSLGQGTSIAAGLGYALRCDKKNQYVYLICGDGELNEGQCWEAFQFIANYRLNHVIVFIDENKRQLDGYTKEVMNPFDIAKKMEAFGFYTQRVDGREEDAIYTAIERAKEITDQAVCIVLDTVKGQGVKYFEEMKDNHSVKFTARDNEEAQRAIEYLEKYACQIEREDRRLCGS